MNPVDGFPRFARRFAFPWIIYPAITGSDVAGEVVETDRP